MELDALAQALDQSTEPRRSKRKVSNCFSSLAMDGAEIACTRIASDCAIRLHKAQLQCGQMEETWFAILPRAYTANTKQARWSSAPEALYRNAQYLLQPSFSHNDREGIALAVYAGQPTRFIVRNGGIQFDSESFRTCMVAGLWQRTVPSAHHQAHSTATAAATSAAAAGGGNGEGGPSSASIRTQSQASGGASGVDGPSTMPPEGLPLHALAEGSTHLAVACTFNVIMEQPRHAQLLYITTAKAQRRKGLARLLLTALQARLANEGTHQCMTVIVSEGKEELWKCLGFDNPNQQEEEEEEDQHQGSQQLLLQATNEVHGFSWLGPRWACGLSQHLSSTALTAAIRRVKPPAPAPAAGSAAGTSGRPPISSQPSMAPCQGSAASKQTGSVERGRADGAGQGPRAGAFVHMAGVKRKPASRKAASEATQACTEPAVNVTTTAAADTLDAGCGSGSGGGGGRGGLHVPPAKRMRSGAGGSAAAFSGQRQQQEALKLSDHVRMVKAYVEALFPCYPGMQEMPLLVWIEVDGEIRPQPHPAYLTPKDLKTRGPFQVASYFDVLKLPVARRDVGSLHGMFHLGWRAAGHGLPAAVAAARAAACGPGMNAQVVMVLSTKPLPRLLIPGTSLSPCTGQQLPSALHHLRRTAVQQATRRPKTVASPHAAAAPAAAATSAPPRRIVAHQSSATVMRTHLTASPSLGRTLPPAHGQVEAANADRQQVRSGYTAGSGGAEQGAEDKQAEQEMPAADFKAEDTQAGCRPDVCQLDLQEDEDEEAWWEEEEEEEGQAENPQARCEHTAGQQIIDERMMHERMVDDEGGEERPPVMQKPTLRMELQMAGTSGWQVEGCGMAWAAAGSLQDMAAAAAALDPSLEGSGAGGASAVGGQAGTAQAAVHVHVSRLFDKPLHLLGCRQGDSGGLSLCGGVGVHAALCMSSDGLSGGPGIGPAHNTTSGAYLSGAPHASPSGHPQTSSSSSSMQLQRAAISLPAQTQLPLHIEQSEQRYSTSRPAADDAAAEGQDEKA